MRIENFGRLSDGRMAGLYILENSNGMKAALTDYGAALVSLIVPDAEGRKYDVVLGYDDVSGYEAGTESFGGTVGRFANRIKNAEFELDGRHYRLSANQGPHTLHGGTDFYVHRLWSAKIPFGEVSSRDVAATYAVESMNDWSKVPNSSVSGQQASGRPGDSITFTLDSPDGDQGFPGAIRIEVTYTLTPENELHLDYAVWHQNQESCKSAGSECSGSESDAAGRTEHTAAGAINKQLPTPLNLTNHSYFNLNGHDSGTVLGHLVWIDSDMITETDEMSVPNGRFIEVAGTPMDFSRAKRLGRDIDEDYEPLHIGNGYDHNYVLKSNLDAEDRNYLPQSNLDADNHNDVAQSNAVADAAVTKGASLIEGQCGYRKVAELYSEDSGIAMSVLTDLPGMQLYTANYLGGAEGKNGAVYEARSAACFETQFWPDAINKDNFPGGILRAGEEFHSRTTYAFKMPGTKSKVIE